MTSPAFQFYIQDFLTGTMHMSAEEIGAYMLLLCHQWDKGFLPNDDKELMKITRVKMKTLAGVKMKFAACEDGMLRNTRLEKEREKQAAFRKQRQEAGAAGNAKRWRTGSNGKEEASLSDTAATPLRVANDRSSLSISSLSSPSASDIHYVNKKTRVGNLEFDMAASALMAERFGQGIAEMMMNQYRTLRVEEVMAEIDMQCPTGTIFTNEQHLLNKFKSVATAMLRTKQIKPVKPRAHDYARYKRT